MPHRRPGARGGVARWVAGFAIATLLVWGLSWPFVDSVMVWQRDEAVDSYVPSTRYTYRFHREGWGSTRFAAHGGLGNMAGPAPRVALWGDSYVEALQVDDHAKLPAQIHAVSGGRLTAVAVARSSWGLADYVRAMPLYEPLLSPQEHYVVAAQLMDFAAYRDTNGFVLRPTSATPHYLGPRRFVADLGLHFAWSAMRTLVRGEGDGVRSLRFGLGPASQEAANGESAELSESGIDFVVAQLRAATTTPITLVFAPCTPTLRDGYVSEHVAHEALIADVASACRRHGIAFVDLRESFHAFYASSGRFGCGFDNGIPSRGHYNEDGHRLVASAIAEHAR